MDPALARKLVRQSLRIEGILRPPRKREIEEFLRFVAVPVPDMRIMELVRLVNVFQPDAILRNRPGVNVYIGGRRAVLGGPMVEQELRYLIEEIKTGKLDPHKAHCEYEKLHPFTDCNGRSGRALWAWHMVHMGKESKLALPELFLHRFYYDALSRYSEL